METVPVPIKFFRLVPPYAACLLEENVPARFRPLEDEMAPSVPKASVVLAPMVVRPVYALEAEKFRVAMPEPVVLITDIPPVPVMEPPKPIDDEAPSGMASVRVLLPSTTFPAG